jgi:hypothetical protein
MATVPGLSPEEQQKLLEQYSDAFSDSQRTYDASLRTFAAGGLAVTTSLGTALDQLGWTGVIAIVLFLGTLVTNLVSYWSDQRDLRCRVDGVFVADPVAASGNRWTKLTTTLNYVGGAALIAGGAFLAIFVATTTNTTGS